MFFFSMKQRERERERVCFCWGRGFVLDESSFFVKIKQPFFFRVSNFSPPNSFYFKFTRFFSSSYSSPFRRVPRLGRAPRLRGRPRLERQGVEPRLQFPSQSVVHESVPRDGVFARKGLGDGVNAKVRLCVGGARGVSGVTGVEVRLVGYCERDGGEGGLELAVFFFVVEVG